VSVKQFSLLGDEPRPLSPVRLRLLNAAGEIAATEPDEFAFQHSLLCQTYLPARRPKPDMLVWQRRQGRATLLVEAGRVMSPQANGFVQLGLPFGPGARLLLTTVVGLQVDARKGVSPATARSTLDLALRALA